MALYVVQNMVHNEFWTFSGILTFEVNGLNCSSPFRVILTCVS